jgi:SAM-dependent methyltransferase
MRRQLNATEEPRALDQLRKHYEIEKELASKLRGSTKGERRSLYSVLYDELYRRVPDHPMLTRKQSAAENEQIAREQMRAIKPFLNKSVIFLEIGPGDCALSFEVAKQVRKVYAVDVSAAITEAVTVPENFELVISDGCSIPTDRNVVDVAYSNQLMEHLHPDDAVEQLTNIYAALAAGGSYICITPNRLTGPHDISMYFDDEATGFHLKEYTITELNALFNQLRFSKVRASIGARGKYMTVPVLPLLLLERFLQTLPYRLGSLISRWRPFRALLDIRLVATK